MHKLISPDSAQRSSGDKSVGCVVQANRCLTSCGEVPQSVQMSLGSPKHSMLVVL